MASPIEEVPDKIPIYDCELASLPCPAFEYDTLATPRSIRLVTEVFLISTLAVGPVTAEGKEAFAESIHVSLETVELTKYLEYDCLSYTWGNPFRVFLNKDELKQSVEWFKRSKTILCNGALLAIGQDLLSFLGVWIAASTSDEKARAGCFVPMRPMWIDAVCVNQSDLAERGTQIAFEGSALDESATRATRSVDIFSFEYAKLAQVGLSTPIDVLALYAFLQRSWFRRAWILQEAVLAKEIVLCYGREELDFLILTRAVSFLSRSGWWKQVEDDARIRLKHGISKKLFEMLQPSGRNPQQVLDELSAGGSKREPYIEIDNDSRFDPVRAIESILSLRHDLRRQQEQGKRNLLSYGELFTQFRYLQATDPRDKIYAVLGLHSSAAPPSVLWPDYAKSNKFESLYTAATAYTIQTSEDLDMLSFRESNQSGRSPNLPSWVPDLSTTQGVPHIPLLDQVTSRTWTASGDIEMQVKFAGSSLMARGFHVDNIQHAAKYELEDLTSVLPVIWSVHIASGYAPYHPQTGRLSVPDSSLRTRRLCATSWRWRLDDAMSSEHLYTYTVGTALKMALRIKPYLRQASEEKRSRERNEHANPSLLTKAGNASSTSYRPLVKSPFPHTIDFTPIVEALDVASLPSNHEQIARSARSAILRNAESPTMLPSRLATEVLWRTLVADQCHQTCPASMQMAHAYASCLAYRMHEMFQMALSASLLLMNQEQNGASEAQIAQHEAERDFGVTALMKNLNLLSVLSGHLPRDPPTRTKFDRRLSESDVCFPSLDEDEARGHGQDRTVATLTAPTKALPDMTQLVDELNRFDDFPKDSGDMKEFWARRDAISTHRRLFTTAKCGYMGNGPDKLRGSDPKKQYPPDEVWVLAGGKVPYVLRPKGNGTYEFLGEAYVHGIMYGEAVKGRENEFVKVTLE